MVPERPIAEMRGLARGTKRKGLREKKPTRDVLKEVYGLNPIQLEERWSAWVLETYPSR